MRILYLTAGAGELYCGACAHDVNLTQGLRAQNQEVTVVPLYTPLRSDHKKPAPTTRVFFGGIMVYLQQHYPRFSVPPLVRRFLSSNRLLRWIGKLAVNTDPGTLGPMTVSMLKGEQGYQRESLRELLTFLKQSPAPEIIHITNSLLSGIARELKREFAVPIYCNFQGEDSFLEAMGEVFQHQALALMKENFRYIDYFLCCSEHYKQRMAELVQVNPDKIHVIPPGVSGQTYSYFPYERRNSKQISLLYLSRIAPEKGLDLLLQALGDLPEGLPPVALKIAGKVTNPIFWKKIQEQLIDLPLSWEYLGEVTEQEKIQLLQSSSLLAVPSRLEESRGMIALEAMATGTPVLVPDSGIFPELINATEGGILFQKRNSQDLQEKLVSLLQDHSLRRRLADKATVRVKQKYAIENMAYQMIEIYQNALVPKPLADLAEKDKKESK